MKAILTIKLDGSEKEIAETVKSIIEESRLSDCNKVDVLLDKKWISGTKKFFCQVGK